MWCSRSGEKTTRQSVDRHRSIVLVWPGFTGRRTSLSLAIRSIAYLKSRFKCWLLSNVSCDTQEQLVRLDSIRCQSRKPLVSVCEQCLAVFFAIVFFCAVRGCVILASPSTPGLEEESDLKTGRQLRIATVVWQINFVFSGVECKDEIYSASQLSVNSCNNNNVPEIVLTSEEKGDIQKPVTVTTKFIVPYVESPASTPPPRPQTATSKIFAPRTEEMSKGFLTFSEEEPGLTSEYPFLFAILCNLRTT